MLTLPVLTKRDREMDSILSPRHIDQRVETSDDDIKEEEGGEERIEKSLMAKVFELANTFCWRPVYLVGDRSKLFGDLNIF